MRFTVLPCLLVLGSCAVPQPAAETHGPPLEIAGRTPGAAQRCVALNQMDGLRISESDPSTLVYGSGRTIWVNHLGHCLFRRDEILVTEPTGSQLCAGDIVRSIDRNSRIPGPSCVLGDFVRYNR